MSCLELNAKPGTVHGTAASLRALIAASGKDGQLTVEVEGLTIRIVAHTDPADEWLRGLAEWLQMHGVDVAVLAATVGEA